MSLKKAGRRGKKDILFVCLKGGGGKPLALRRERPRKLKDKAEAYPEEKILSSLG